MKDSGRKVASAVAEPISRIATQGASVAGRTCISAPFTTGANSLVRPMLKTLRPMPTKPARQALKMATAIDRDTNFSTVCETYWPRKIWNGSPGPSTAFRSLAPTISPRIGAVSRNTVRRKAIRMIRPMVCGRFMSSLNSNACEAPPRVQDALFTARATTPTPAASHAPLSTLCGCATRRTASGWTWAAPTPATSRRAANSISRKTPVMYSLVRMFSMASVVTTAMVAKVMVVSSALRPSGCR